MHRAKRKLAGFVLRRAHETRLQSIHSSCQNDKEMKQPCILPDYPCPFQPESVY
jgi:hypothetical protein